MTLQDIAIWVAIISAIGTGIFAAVRSTVLIVLWVQRQKSENGGFTNAEVGRGMNVDAAQGALRSLEEDFKEHTEQDRKQFLVIAKSLGRIEQKLGIRSDFSNGEY